MNCLWIPTSALPASSSGGVSCYAYHKTSIGHAIGQEIKTEINYLPQKVAWLVNSYLSMGAVQIDASGIVKIACT
jgi:hypothetical protein